jgi:bacillithiol biosynthesis cysteine-adding enzyme BshC
MYSSIPFSKLNSSSKLFVDFIENIQQNNYESINQKIPEVLKRKHYKSKLIEAVKSTSNKFELYQSQKENIELLKSENTLAVVSGQQAGFLGGSLYTLYKALDTHIISKKLRTKFPEYNFVPIFWIEDNDNDLEESSHTMLYDNDYNPVPLKLNFDDTSTVSHTFIDENSLEIINKAKSLIQNLHPNGAKYSELIDLCYQSGISWSESFAHLLHSILGKLGILMVSASKLMATGTFKELVIRELTEPGASKNLIEKRNEILMDKGFNIQAQASDINLFYHINNHRFRIDTTDTGFVINGTNYTKSDILAIANNNPERFSPKVLTRPLFQDFSIPTICYIAGPGEIAYLSQIDYLYNNLNIEKPALLMRTSLTIIDKKISRYLQKINKNPDYFFNKFSEIEKEIANELLGIDHEEHFIDFRKLFDFEFEKLEKYLMRIDNQLERTIKGAYTKIQEQIEQLDKKAHSFAKRNNEELLQKYKSISHSVIPTGIQQERMISPLQYLASTDNFIEILLNIQSELSNKHHFIEI